ncbi:MAG: DUF4924 family protein [Chlorobi bacterium]|nr:DUF4924 family protein [Chlorobiota bacterium]
MFIAEDLKKNNIAEYIIYMWQTEDMIRSLDFDIEKIQEQIIDKYDIDDEAKAALREWYLSLIQMAELENIKESGHLQVITNIVNDLNDLHLWLLSEVSQIQYRQAYEFAAPNIKLLSSKMKVDVTNEIDICLHGLYAIMLLKLQKKEIHKDTLAAVDSFRKLISILVSKYHDREKHPEKYYK